MSGSSAGGRNWSDLGSRIASAAVMAAVGFSMIAIGVSTTGAIVAIGCGIMGWEWRRISAAGVAHGLTDMAAVIACALPAVLTYIFDPLIGSAVAVIGTAATAAVAPNASDHLRKSWPGLLVIALAGVAFVWLRSDLPFGLHIAFWLLLVVIAADVGAYFAGRFIGGPKLAPKISPNKTVSGAVGGQAAGILMGVGYAASVGIGNLGIVAGISFLTAIVSQLGDLMESAAKRHYGVKDASALIPGHGGLLDRFDGLLAATLFTALVTMIAGATVFAW